ncbi:M43 family zinc metalloprotease [Muricauda sp. ANG21]|uniref:M43 family zinc metalloprotease n=1 Tax=Allomuricauda sp. ANG21 TaxID=3042468 RepID=UPI00345344FD
MERQKWGNRIFNFSAAITLMALLSVFIISCSKNTDEAILPELPDQVLFRLPIVVHVIHNGEAMGEGPNLSTDRIKRQIEILNEDFRRKKGTRGYNEHPDGGDAKIEFFLAKVDPNGKPTDGINRINASKIEVPELGYSLEHYAQYAYWPPNRYINVWTTPLNNDFMCLALGLATGPETDLPGTDLLALPKSGEPDGILINWNHFGESTIDCHARFGRTLTHEMGHFLGLLHTWGGKDCETNDYCDDTPAVDKQVFGRSPFMGCAGEMVMIENYMNWSDDEVMNTFTNDQIDRMHYVLSNHEGRKALSKSGAEQSKLVTSG